ncbi:hypothetical protein PCANC_20136 [Puccinia coronata f. sp. avenae]|uniref:M-phase inducer phosphatase n=1 Tax=Puccinia coronata f. sp. avenae TaxID=200324 RepID=A0A2N5TWG0_9BASI|nr:hypothetical protein PCANC_20136 [Puccinia coronata f. sp. avenae]
MPASHLLLSSSPTPAHQLHHSFQHFQPYPSTLFRLSDYRRHQTPQDHDDDSSNPTLLHRFLEVEDGEELSDDHSQKSFMYEEEPHSDLITDDHDLQASWQEDAAVEDDDRDDETGAEQVLIGALSPSPDVPFKGSATSVGIAHPTTPSPNVQRISATQNVQLARVPAQDSSLLPIHLLVSTAHAMLPPSSSPHRMDISPAPAPARCDIPSYSHPSATGFQPHSPDDPFRILSPRSQSDTLYKVSPTTNEARRTIGLRVKAQSRPNLSSGSYFLHPSSTLHDEKSSPSNLPRSADCMDIDSPSYAQPHQCHDICGSQMRPDDQPADSLCSCQGTSRSPSQSSTGKRSRSNEVEDREQPSSPLSRGRQQERRTSVSRVSSSPSRMSLAGPSHSFSPFQSSSPSDIISPSLKVASKMNVGHKAGGRSLSGFRFPVPNSHLPSVPNPLAARATSYELGVAGASAGKGAVLRRPKLEVVQSSATLFGRHQSTSIASGAGMNRQRDVFGRPASKSRRAISFAAAEGDGLNFMLQGAGHSLVADPDEDDDDDDDESEPEDSLLFHCSPAARASQNASGHPLVSTTWPKYTDSPIRPNRSASHHGHRLNVARKASTSGASTSMPPPPTFSFGMTVQSPTRTLVPSFSASVESPMGMAFSEKERAGKILPCHKVSHDGLMRISPDTMDRLLDGLYDDQICHKIVIDCRFGYEFDAGHISSAINVPDKEVALRFLLQGDIFPNGKNDVPLPSESGKTDASGKAKKVVVVFHCEYSAMRAPTVAKYVREQDRHMNMTQYPALHYPEVYILEGGYARYHAHSPQHCQGSYVSMDDPNHRRDRQADLSHFRTREHAASSRAKSFTYGENHATVSRNCSLPQKTAPLLVPAPGSQLSPQQQARQL